MRTFDLRISAKVMLSAVAEHSNNELCKGRAKMYLNPEESGVDIDMVRHIARGEGSFMSACLAGEFERAYRLADNSNRKALDTIKLIFNS